MPKPSTGGNGPNHGHLKGASMADDAIVAQYIVKTDAAIANLNKLSAQVANIQKTSEKSAKGSEDAFAKMSDNITNQFKALGSSLVAAFAVDRLISFGSEAVKLAGKVEGVKIAFDRLNRPDLLNQLREATKGTVSDLGLMTAAVRAQNFKIPLEQMATLLEFARRRAKETGEDINFLVESIVVGIGRKSPLILDNLGISAVELRKRFAGVSIEAANVGDVAKIVGDIATESLKEMGDEADTTADKLARNAAAIENFTVAFGNLFTGVVGSQLEVATKQINIFTATGIDGFEKLRLIMAAARGDTEQYTATMKALAVAETEAAKAKARRFDVQEDLTVQEIDARLRAREEAVGVEVEIRNVAFLTAAIKALNEERALETTSVARNFEILDELIPLQAELDALNRKEADSVKAKTDAYKDLNAILDQTNKAYQDYIDHLLDFNDFNAKTAELAVLKDTGKDAKQRAEELNAIEQARLQERIRIQQLYGRESIDTEIQLETAKVKTFEEIWAEEEAKYKRFLDGQTADYEASLQERIDLAKQAEQDLQEFQAGLQSKFFEGATMAIQISADQQAALIDQQMELLQESYDKGEISEDQFRIKQTQIRRKAAQQQKDTATFNATVNMFQSASQAIGSLPPPYSYILAALSLATGAAQIAAIQATPLPQFEKGGEVPEDGWIKGKRHSQGGVKLEAEGGEFIVNRKSAAKYGDLLHQINDDRLNLSDFNKGWDSLPEMIELNGGGNDFNDSNLLRAIDRHRESDNRGVDRLAAAIIKAARIQDNTRTRWN